MDREHLKSIVETYRRLNFSTALDDFGSGYAGLALLAEFQPDILKIDRLLIDHIDVSRPKQVIVASIITTAHALGISVVAEGVERTEESRTLQKMGINLFQVSLFARPAINRLIPDEEINWGND